MPDTRNKESFLQEDQKIRARLAELEETLRAIRSGEVDALVVSTPKGEQVFTLKGAEEPYRVMVETMSEGAVTASADGTILYCNNRFAKLLKTPLEQVIGSRLHDFVPPGERSGFETMLAQTRKAPASRQVTLQPADGTGIAVLFSIRSLTLNTAETFVAVVTDLSEVNAAQEARSRLALIVESSDDAIISTGIDGVVQSWNAAAERMFGYTAAEAIGHSAQEIIVPPELSGQYLQLITQALRGDRLQHIEVVRRRKDGTLIDISLSRSPIRDAAGKVIGISAIMRDITERKRAEDALRANERLFRTMMENFPGSAAIYDAERRFKYINPFGRLATGLGLEQHIGKRDEDIRPPEATRAYLPLLLKAYETRARQSQEIEVPLHTGTYTLAINYIPILDEKNMIDMVLGVGIDITERKRAERELQQSHERLRMIAETIQDVFWISAPGVTEVLYISPAYERLWERSCESLYREPKSFLDAMHPDDRPGFARIIELHRSGQPYETEYRIVQRSGEVRWIRERGFPARDSEGQLKAMTGVCTDITELKHAQEELEQHRQHLEELVAERTKALSESEKRYRHEAVELAAANAKLQELDRLKSMFIASMSHELRTPLNSIIGFTGVILQGIAGPISEEQRKQLNIVKESASHLLQLINDVIDVSKIEADKAEVTMDEFELPELMQEAASSFAVTAQKKGIELAVEAPERLRLTSDRRRVRQILVNLLDNAMKFTDTGRIVFRASGNAEGVKIEVRDTGIGISPEDMARLFGAFSQIVVEGRPREGSGLGLYLSQKTAKLLGGRITAQSEPGKGSVFTLSLPANLRRAET